VSLSFRFKSGWPLGVVGLLLAVLLVAGAWLAVVRLEGEGPFVSVDPPSPLYLGKASEVAVTVADPKSGLRRLEIVLTKDGKRAVLADTPYPSSGLLGLEKVREDRRQVKIDPALLGFTDGKAVMAVRAWDYSWRNWWNGNVTTFEVEVTVDTRPPAIESLTQQNYVNQGGAGVAVYRLSEPCPVTGVRVGGTFFPGYGGYYPDPLVHIAFFAFGHQQGAGTEIVIEAVDQAGNSARGRYAYHFKPKKFKRDTLNVSDGFITQILPDFQAVLPAQTNATLKDRFLYINRDLRAANYRTITEVTRNTGTGMLWKGPFTRLPNAAPRAGFADHRTYLYEGREIDQQYHLGVDLASLAHSPVPAANGGVVVFAGELGIYGRTVMLDHGFGLFTMYSHLSRITVQKGNRVAKDAVIGNTGSTGLAGGDHLHFGVLVQNTFVDPVEWWDPHWITDNVILKLDTVKGGGGQG
jgi:murein DD-endopeptidase MepM/ murein hydrolase activator NlpD